MERTARQRAKSRVHGGPYAGADRRRTSANAASSSTGAARGGAHGQDGGLSRLPELRLGILAVAKRKVPVVVPVHEIHEILDAVSDGQRADLAQLQLVANAAALMRRNWLQELSHAMGFLRPMTAEFESFKKCTQTMLTLFVQHGIISSAEMQHIWMSVEDLEKR